MALVGCAGTTPPMDTLSAADTAVNRAIEAKAMEHAPMELYQAQQKLDRARSAMNEEDYEQARRLAEEAQVDARLAEVKSQSQTARQQAQEIQQTINSLQHEASERDQKATGR